MGDTERSVTVICPTHEELSVIYSVVKCPEEGCGSTFHGTSNLAMHLVKHHKKNEELLKKKNEDARYHCPVSKCVYELGRDKFFKKLKYLKQHYLKVHLEKKIDCEKCSKTFSTDWSLKQHLKNCGVIYVCSCGWTYNSNEAILTHCRRKGHTMANKISPTPDKQTQVTEKYTETSSVKVDRLIPIYPKFSVPYVAAAVALIELSTTTIRKAVDKEIQTDSVETLKTNKRIIHQNKIERRHKTTQQTQTVNKCKRTKISAETQTNSDYVKHVKNRRNTQRKRKKSMETQTNKRIKINKKSDPVETSVEQHGKTNQISYKNISNIDKEIFEDSLSSNEKMIGSIHAQTNPVKSDLSLLDTIEDDESEKTWFESTSLKQNYRSSKARQSFITTINNENFSSRQELGLFANKNEENVNSENIFDINKFSNIETQTELNTLLMDCGEDTSFTLCSTTETQTTDDFDPLLYTHMYTQTCDEVDNLFDFNFVDIQTQTAWPDLDDCEYLSS